MKSMWMKCKNGEITETQYLDCLAKNKGYSNYKEYLRFSSFSYTIKLEKRFWAHVDIKGEDDCWEWKSCLNEDGYGKFFISRLKKSSHRVAYELTKGKIPDGLNVLHSCDNRSCCNPKHLWVGTNFDNNMDRDKKGRQYSKITKENVIEIRSLYSSGKFTQQEIADRFGVTDALISLIVNNKRWVNI